MSPKQRDLQAIASVRQAIEQAEPGSVEVVRLLRMLDQRLLSQAVLVENSLEVWEVAS